MRLNCFGLEDDNFLLEAVYLDFVRLILIFRLGLPENYLTLMNWDILCWSYVVLSLWNSIPEKCAWQCYSVVQRNTPVTQLDISCIIKKPLMGWRNKSTNSLWLGITRYSSRFRDSSISIIVECSLKHLSFIVVLQFCLLLKLSLLICRF